MTLNPQTALIERINQALPQTQCTQCGFSGCKPYARAIVENNEPINQCPPGGAQGIATLAQLTGRAVVPLNPDCGQELPLAVALIVEADCIGCTKCIQACPVDAIIGANKLMHTVLADLCTGCGLCVPPCPVDCIEMPAAVRAPWSNLDAQRAKIAFEQRNARLAQEAASHATSRAGSVSTSEVTDDASSKQSLVLAALERARARRKSSE